MAITINSAGQNGYTADSSGYVSAHEDIWHVVESTNKNVVGFKYLFDIYKGNTLLTRIANSPYGADKKGVLNVGNIIRSGIQIDYLDIELTIPVSQALIPVSKSTDYWFTQYNVRYGEICGTTNLGEPNVLPDLASGTYTAYNTYNRHTIHGSGARLSNSKIFLTNRPSISYFYGGEPLVISLNERAIDDKYDIDVYQEYEGNDTLIASSTVDTPVGALTYFSINALNQNFDHFVSIDYGVIPAPRMSFKPKCAKYKPYTLIFLNCYGGWDSFTFVNGNVLTDNEKKKFEQNRWRITNGTMYDRFSLLVEGGSQQYTKYEGVKTYGVKFKTKMKLTSDILNTEEYKWLFELIVSPIVYLWDKDALTLYPVQITDSNYEIKNSLQNKTEFIEVNIDVFDQNTQYR